MPTFPTIVKGFFKQLGIGVGVRRGRVSAFFPHFFFLATWINTLMSLYHYRPCGFCALMPHCIGGSYKLLGSGPINLFITLYPRSECSVGFATLLGCQVPGLPRGSRVGLFPPVRGKESFGSHWRPTWRCTHVRGGEMGSFASGPFSNG